jgi:hypothetical protein
VRGDGTNEIPLNSTRPSVPASGTIRHLTWMPRIAPLSR